MDSRISKPVPVKVAPRGLACSSTACSMGSSTGRLYSALAQPLSSTGLAQPEPCLEQGAHEESADPDRLMKECEEALRNRPARLHRDFVFPEGSGPLSQPIRVMQWNILAQALGEGKDSFVECPLDALNWAERKYLILEEILTYPARHPVPAGAVVTLPGCGAKQRARRLRPLLPPGPRFELLDSASLRLTALALKTNQVAIVQTLRCRATGRPPVHGGHPPEGAERLGTPSQRPGLGPAAEPAGGCRRGPGACRCCTPPGRSGPPGRAATPLDYIWYSQVPSAWTSVLDLPTEQQIGPGRLPSYSYPSDHISLVCDIRFQDNPDQLQ
ncbi:hypothetical protein SKAU_G00033930 [Synaphobranchus kaupii]|uniref:Nocturnin n=1 Tax=Synaphobranchus kaupii TaxID=118154 RepID=A0A9Q1GFK7_SYNKA|nr:hypothetical protein SKAU_G00033930 [Synaphobranchus kaupii]